MPWGDGTGPLGMGPMTGRGFGFCSGYNRPGAETPRFGRGFRRGRGFGPGRGPGFRAGYPGPDYRAAGFAYGPRPYARQEMNPELERQELELEANHLRESLANLEKRIADLQSEENKQES